MAEMEYAVVSYGEILRGFERDQVIQNLAALFKQPIEKVTHILDRPRSKIKSGLTEAKANKYFHALTKAGLKVAIEPAAEISMAPSAEAASLPANTASANATQKMAAPPLQAAATEEQASEDGRVLPFAFNGQGNEYFKIWIVNLLLSIVTLGIYSAWAKVRNKKYFYGNMNLEGSSFEYTGNPVAILKGRIIAAVFFLLYATAGEFSPVLGGIMFLVFLAVMPWMVTRSLMFNARNSVYRNVSFRFHGSMKEAFMAFGLWPFLGALTFGILAPFALYKQQVFFVNNHSYGTARFEFSAVVKDYYLVFGMMILVLIGGFVGGAVLNAILPPVGVLLILAGYLFAFVFFSAKIFNLRFNNSMLASHGFAADMEVKSYAKLVVVNTLATMVTLGLYRPWAMVRTARYKAEHLQFIATGELGGFIAAEEQNLSALGEEVGDMFDFDVGL